MENDNYHATLDLAECVREAGREILAKGHNPKFVKEHGETMTKREVCVAMINEAKKIKAMGYNAKFSCHAIDLLKRSDINRRQYLKKKGDGGDDEGRED